MIGTPSSLRLYNKRAIVHELLRRMTASRAELAKAVGMSQVTAGKIVDALLAEGIVEEVEGRGSGRLGRPGRMLRLNGSQARFIAVELGTLKTRLARVPIGLCAEDRWTEEFDTPQDSLADWKAMLGKACRGMADEGIAGALVSVPGVVDERAGEVLLAPNLHWLDRVNLIDAVGKVLGLQVTCLQEIRAQAYGQLALEGADSKWPRDFLMVDFGEGLGAAAAINGKVFVGPLALNGELGHTPVVGNVRKCGCGAVGCVETLVNRAGLLASLAEQTRKRGVQWEDLVRHVEEHGVGGWLSDSLKQVATAIAAAANVMGIQRVIITGSLSELPPVVMDELSRAVVEGCLWKRFGQMICHAGPRHRMAGLVAAGIDRLVLPLESWVR